VLRDAQDPAVNLSATADGTDIHLNWSATDTGSGLAMCALEYRENEGSWQPFSEECGGPDTFEDAQTGVLYTFRLTASDNIGNEAQAEANASTKHITKYYYFGGQRVAMRGPDDAVSWLHGDHLGSTSLARRRDVADRLSVYRSMESEYNWAVRLSRAFLQSVARALCVGGFDCSQSRRSAES